MCHKKFLLSDRIRSKILLDRRLSLLHSGLHPSLQRLSLIIYKDITFNLFLSFCVYFFNSNNFCGNFIVILSQFRATTLEVLKYFSKTFEFIMKYYKFVNAHAGLWEHRNGWAIFYIIGLEYFNKYLPNSYYDLQYITGIKEEIKMRIKEYEMSNYWTFSTICTIIFIENNQLLLWNIYYLFY